LLSAIGMYRAYAIASALAVVTALVQPANATAEGTLPGRAGMCRGFDGLAFTFCVALCEARACDLRPSEDARCAILRRGFARVTGGSTPPCAAEASASIAPRGR
jgi:hypothetical protein